jgi:hypothetical protein
VRVEGLVSSQMERQTAKDLHSCSECPVDQKLLNSYVFGLMGFCAACLYLLVIAVGLRKFVSRLLQSGRGKHAGSPENGKRGETAGGSRLNVNHNEAGLGLAAGDQGLFERARAGKSGGAIDDSSNR